MKKEIFENLNMVNDRIDKAVLKIQELEKENRELKRKVFIQEEIIIGEQQENAELKAKLKGFENGEVAWQGDMDKTIKQNLELKAQIKLIKKMKCCENCKNYKTEPDSYGEGEIHYCVLYRKYECVNLDKWELAE